MEDLKGSKETGSAPVDGRDDRDRGAGGENPEPAVIGGGGTPGPAPAPVRPLEVLQTPLAEYRPPRVQPRPRLFVVAGVVDLGRDEPKVRR